MLSIMILSTITDSGLGKGSLYLYRKRSGLIDRSGYFESRFEMKHFFGRPIQTFSDENTIIMNLPLKQVGEEASGDFSSRK